MNLYFMNLSYGNLVYLVFRKIFLIDHYISIYYYFWKIVIILSNKMIIS